MNPLLEVEGLEKSFRTGRGMFTRSPPLVAVKDVSFSVSAGQTFGIIGESGSGKSTTARIICRLLGADRGSVYFQGENILSLQRSAARKLTRRIQIVLQDPSASLNPRWKVGRLIAEGLHIHRLADKRSRIRKVGSLLEQCGLDARAADKYPHEFSGGQRQRIAIARALALSPELLVLDEPVSALDVSVQAQILALLKELQRDMGLTYLFISHDLAVVEHFCDELAVMHNGKIVDRGTPREVYLNAEAEYTKALIQAHPLPDPRAVRGRRHRTARELSNADGN